MLAVNRVVPAAQGWRIQRHGLALRDDPDGSRPVHYVIFLGDDVVEPIHAGAVPLAPHTIAPLSAQLGREILLAARIQGAPACFARAHLTALVSEPDGRVAGALARLRHFERPVALDDPDLPSGGFEIDPARYQTIVQESRPGSQGLGEAEQASFVDPALDGLYDPITDILKRHEACAITGALMPPWPFRIDGFTMAMIRPFKAGGRAEPHNLLPATLMAANAFENGHVAIDAQGHLRINMGLIDPDLVRDLPSAGLAFLPNDPALRPAASALRYHKRWVFD